MKNFYFIGVDVSKKKLDVCVLYKNKVIHEEVISNHQGAAMALICRIKDEFGIDNGELLVCAEHTGQYTYPLVCACQSLVCQLWLENPSNIKYSSGVQRGKNDKIDARRIAVYAARFQDKACCYERPTEDIERLKQLESERTLYVNHLATYKAQLKDQKGYMSENNFNDKVKRLQKLMKELNKTIDGVVREMKKVVNGNKVLSRQHDLLQSIDGVGPIVALNMIVVTEAFTRFENARQFNCYAGLAPFEYLSGSSQHSKARVSHRADKTMKKLLHLAAIATIRKEKGELKEYFLRKVAQGKNKMSVINAIRAKIVARMFALIKRNDTYKPIFPSICLQKP